MFADVSESPCVFPFFPYPTAADKLPPLIKQAREGPTGYGHGYEAQVIHNELNGFDFQSCPAWRAVTDYFGTNIRLRELKGIVFTLLFHLQHQSHTILPALSRNEKRSLGLLVRYINTHYPVLVPLFPFVKLCDENHDAIPFLDATVLHDSQNCVL
jgi:hypothetical protein